MKAEPLDIAPCILLYLPPLLTSQASNVSELTPSNVAEHKILLLTDAARQVAQSLGEQLHAWDGAPDADAKSLLVEGFERLENLTRVASGQMSNDVREEVRDFFTQTASELREWLLVAWANLFSAWADQIAASSASARRDNGQLVARLRQLEDAAAMLRQCNRLDEGMAAKLDRAREAVAKASS